MKKLTLIDNVGRVWHRLWSVRLALLSALLSALEFALQLAPDAIADMVGRGRFAAAAFGISVSAAVARIVAQPRLDK